MTSPLTSTLGLALTRILQWCHCALITDCLGQSSSPRWTVSRLLSKTFAWHGPWCSHRCHTIGAMQSTPCNRCRAISAVQSGPCNHKAAACHAIMSQSKSYNRRPTSIAIHSMPPCLHRSPITLPLPPPAGAGRRHCRQRLSGPGWRRHEQPPSHS